MPWVASDTGWYSYSDANGQANGTMIALLLIENGFSLESACAALGNISKESGINPWAWEGNYLPSFQVPTVAEFESWTYQQSLTHGYGLFGFTPANTYINQTNSMRYAQYGFSPHFRDYPGLPRDGEAQVRYALADSFSQNWAHGLYNQYQTYFSQYGVDINDFYWMTYSQFKAGTGYTIAQLTGAFELCWEKPGFSPAASSYASRVENAEGFYQYFQTHPIVPTASDEFNIMFYLKPRWKKF